MKLADAGCGNGRLAQLCGEPTADGDAMAGYLREWYERNRESWWERRRRRRYPGNIQADSFMIRLMMEVGRIEAEMESADIGQ
jgi:hypothetical protein